MVRALTRLSLPRVVTGAELLAWLQRRCCVRHLLLRQSSLQRATAWQTILRHLLPQVKQPSPGHSHR